MCVCVCAIGSVFCGPYPHPRILYTVLVKKEHNQSKRPLCSRSPLTLSSLSPFALQRWPRRNQRACPSGRGGAVAGLVLRRRRIPRHRQHGTPPPAMDRYDYSPFKEASSATRVAVYYISIQCSELPTLVNDILHTETRDRTPDTLTH